MVSSRLKEFIDFPSSVSVVLCHTMYHQYMFPFCKRFFCMHIINLKLHVKCPLQTNHSTTVFSWPCHMVTYVQPVLIRITLLCRRFLFFSNSFPRGLNLGFITSKLVERQLPETTCPFSFQDRPYKILRLQTMYSKVSFSSWLTQAQHFMSVLPRAHHDPAYSRQNTWKWKHG